MGFEMALKKRIKICYLSLKSLKIYYFVPYLFIYILVPLLDHIQVKTMGLNNFDLHVRANTQMFLPFFTAWWIILILREYVEGEGNEVLYIYGKIKIFEVVLIYATYSIHFIPLYFAYSIYLDNMALELVRILIQSFFFASLAYFLMYLTHSGAITLMSIMIYNITVNFYAGTSFFKYISIYDYTRMSYGLLLQKYLPVFLISLIFLGVGVLRNKFFYR